MIYYLGFAPIACLFSLNESQLANKGHGGSQLEIQPGCELKKKKTWIFGSAKCVQRGCTGFLKWWLPRCSEFWCELKKTLFFGSAKCVERGCKGLFTRCRKDRCEWTKTWFFGSKKCVVKGSNL